MQSFCALIDYAPKIFLDNQNIYPFKFRNHKKLLDFQCKPQADNFLILNVVVSRGNNNFTKTKLIKREWGRKGKTFKPIQQVNAQEVSTCKTTC